MPHGDPPPFNPYSTSSSAIPPPIGPPLMWGEPARIGYTNPLHPVIELLGSLPGGSEVVIKIGSGAIRKIEPTITVGTRTEEDLAKKIREAVR